MDMNLKHMAGEHAALACIIAIFHINLVMHLAPLSPRFAVKMLRHIPSNRELLVNIIWSKRVQYLELLKHSSCVNFFPMLLNWLADFENNTAQSCPFNPQSFLQSLSYNSLLLFDKHMHCRNKRHIRLEHVICAFASLGDCHPCTEQATEVCFFPFFPGINFLYHIRFFSGQ